MVQAKDERELFPHVSFREVAGTPEAYILGTGLAIWEVALLGEGYGNDAEAIARHTLADCALIQEGLRYASQHRLGTDAAIARHTANSPEELRNKVPGVRMLVIGRESHGEPSP